MVIAIEEGDELALRDPDAGIACNRPALVRVMGQIADAGVGNARNLGPGIVARCIVDDNDFKVGEGLIQCAAQALRNAVAAVVRGDDNPSPVILVIASAVFMGTARTA